MCNKEHFRLVVVTLLIATILGHGHAYGSEDQDQSKHRPVSYLSYSAGLATAGLAALVGFFWPGHDRNPPTATSEQQQRTRQHPRQMDEDPTHRLPMPQQRLGFVDMPTGGTSALPQWLFVGREETRPPENAPNLHLIFTEEAGALEEQEELRPEVLVVVDMQPRFPAADSEELQERIETLIHETLVHGGHVIFLEYGYNPDEQREHSPTHERLTNAASIAPERVFVLRKTMNSGAREISRLCKEVFGSNKPRLHLCGVNTNYCVKSTAALAVLHGFPVSVIASACNDETEKRHKMGLREMRRRGVHVEERR